MSLAGESMEEETDLSRGPVLFRHDPRLFQSPPYFITLEQSEAFTRAIQAPIFYASAGEIKGMSAVI
jgi:hypothetical protein